MKGISDIQKKSIIVKWKRYVKRMGKTMYWSVKCIATAFILHYLLLIVVFDTFHTPTESMIPTLLPGDHGYINKLKLGGRIFNIYAAARGEHFVVRRLPGYGHLERGDIIVFNAPFMENWDSIAMDMYHYYSKRVVAIAGDTLDVVDGIYSVRGCREELGVRAQQQNLRRVVDEIMRNIPDSVGLPNWITIGPNDPEFGWTIRDFGPYIVPCKMMRMRIDRNNFLLYRKYIEWETNLRLEWTASGARLGGCPMTHYTFRENYCFAAGDNAVDSQDSRYWGLVPERFIVGIAQFVLKSKRGMRRI